MANGAMAASGGLDLISGILQYFSSKEIAQTYQSRGRMLRMEADLAAERYERQARMFQARQKMAYVKSGVRVSGSALDVLDETMRVASENISAMRAQGWAQQREMDLAAVQTRNEGRMALLKGISSGGMKLAGGAG